MPAIVALSPGDHLRLCGDHYKTYAAWYDAMGSSPPMRGPRICLSTFTLFIRIIPAYAGTTLRLSHMSI